MPTDGIDTSMSARASLARLMDGYLATQLLYVAAKLGIPELLADGPKSAQVVAARLGTEPTTTHRVLRGLAAFTVLDEDQDGHFGLAGMGTLLRHGVPGSLRGAILARGDVYYRAGAELLGSITDGEVAFERAYGNQFFAHLAANPSVGAAFQASMTDRSRHEAADVVAVVDYRRFATVVDVGGGSGILLEAMLEANPALRGTLFDLPEVVDMARNRLEGTGAIQRCSFAAGDFFTTALPPGELLVLSRVLHDWDDSSAVHILRQCRAALRPGGRLHIVEAVLPERAGDVPAITMMDLHMLLLFRNGRERTIAGYEALLVEAGFGLAAVVPTRSAVGLVVIEAECA